MDNVKLYHVVTNDGYTDVWSDYVVAESKEQAVNKAIPEKNPEYYYEAYPITAEGYEIILKKQEEK